MNKGNLNARGVLLTMLAVATAVSAVVGVDRMLLKPNVDTDALYSKFRDAANLSLAASSKLEENKAESLASKFIIPEADPWEPGTPSVEDPNAEDGESTPELEIIRVAGIMKSKDGSFQAIVNNSLVRESSLVYGCKVLKITDASVSFQINERVRTIGINEELKVDAQSSELLDLTEIVIRDGVWVAQVNSHYYRSGDWIDKQTQIRAVTPTKVMIARAGKMIVLTVSK